MSRYVDQSRTILLSWRRECGTEHECHACDSERQRIDQGLEARIDRQCRAAGVPASARTPAIGARLSAGNGAVLAWSTPLASDEGACALDEISYADKREEE